MGKNQRINCVSADGAANMALHYIVGPDSGERDNYVSFCEENEADPRHIRGMFQSGHIYALALIGLELPFPTGEYEAWRTNEWNEYNAPKEGASMQEIAFAEPVKNKEAWKPAPCDACVSLGRTCARHWKPGMK